MGSNTELCVCVLNALLLGHISSPLHLFFLFEVEFHCNLGLRLALDSLFSYLSPQSAGLTDAKHHAQLRRRLK